MKAKPTPLPEKRPLASATEKHRTEAMMKRPGQPVLLQYHDPGASRVFIAGSFNGWRPDALDMVNLGDGKWFQELLLCPGTYEYRLVVDGRWICDPGARSTVPNPFGEANSVLQVVAPSATSQQAGPQKKPAAIPGSLRPAPGGARQRILPDGSGGR